MYVCTHCTPASGFASHVEDQRIVVVRPLQHNITITGIEAGVFYASTSKTALGSNANARKANILHENAMGAVQLISVTS